MQHFSALANQKNVIKHWLNYGQIQESKQYETVQKEQAHFLLFETMVQHKLQNGCWYEIDMHTKMVFLCVGLGKLDILKLLKSLIESNCTLFDIFYIALFT